MNTMNHIPDALFHLIESKDWQELTANEKTLVLKYLLQEDYIHMHEVFVATQKYYVRQEGILPSIGIKNNLKKAFDLQHQKSKMVPLWQAAAVFLIMLSGFVYYTLNHSSIEKTIVNTIHDTLYVPQYVEVEKKITDTLILYKTSYVSQKTKHSKLMGSSDSSVVKEDDNVYVGASQIRTLSPEEITKSIKNLKTKSMQEDTLYNKIGFASI